MAIYKQCMSVSNKDEQYICIINERIETNMRPQWCLFGQTDLRRAWCKS